MDATDKTEFVTELCNTVRDAIVERVRAMPESWEGHELRQYLADEFSAQVIRHAMRGRRLIDYQNDIAVRSAL